MNTKQAPFVIERAQAEDAAALLAFLKIVGGETENLSYGAEGISLDLAAEQDKLRSQAGSINNVRYLAKADGEIIGTASLSRKHKRMRHRGELGICVKRAWWGSGAAPALMDALLAFARENGFEQLNLEVAATTSAPSGCMRNTASGSCASFRDSSRSTGNISILI